MTSNNENIEEQMAEKDETVLDEQETKEPTADAETSEIEETTEQAEEQDPLVAAQLEAEDWKDKYIRLYAEFENYKKRTLKEKTELILNGGEKTIASLLPTLDDFERAIADKTDDATSIKEGFELIYKKFLKTLEGLGVSKIETDDQDFNVDYHEAIAMVPGMGDEKKGKIIDCVQTGYTLNDKVIRHAKVAVGQ